MLAIAPTTSEATAIENCRDCSRWASSGRTFWIMSAVQPASKAAAASCA
jgi:hypothetical protein